MTIRDICTLIEAWAPPAIAWEKDNVGLLIGSAGRRVRKVLVCLDVTPSVVDEAVSAGAGLIVSHHPLIFTPLRRIDPETPAGRMIGTLVRSRIGLYAAHTNFDFTDGGVSHTLARRLGLGNVAPLSPLHGREKKIVVFVPPTHAGGVMQAMAGAGAGVIGRYESCSFTTEGIGSFVPRPGSKPFLGTKGNFERVGETRLEMVCPSWRVEAVVGAMRSVHPYDEPACDVYPTESPSRGMGMGSVGELEAPLGLRPFLGLVARKLRARGLRYSGPRGRRIRRVAVCGGSGSELLGDAVRSGADAFVTADIRYHAFQEVSDDIVLVDAGHYETEHPAVATLAGFLRAAPGVAKERVAVIESKNSHNPVNYFR
jgi:dinuclear metal center YbgI/SA1388 family protein